MFCPSCGSEDIYIQTVQENLGGEVNTVTRGKVKQKGHGCLYWVLIGWWWWIIDAVIWIVAFPFRLAFGLLKKKKYKYSEKTTTVQNNTIQYRNICTCQNCGNTWTQIVS